MNEKNPFREEKAWRRLKELLAKHAEEHLLGHFRCRQTVEFKEDGSPVTEADRSMQEAVRESLARQWPQYAFLGEESACGERETALSAGEGCWILDPLDGTTNYVHGFEMFCSSLALLQEGRVVLGIVCDPLRNQLFAARLGMGAELDGEPLRLSCHSDNLGGALALVDCKRLPPELASFLAVDPPFASQRNIGSVALEWCWMAAGRADLYLHGGQKLWDYAAGHLVFSEAGGASCTLDGEPIPAPVMEPRSAVAASSPALLQSWRECLAGALRAAG